MMRILLGLFLTLLLASAEARFPRGTSVATPQLTCNLLTGVASASGPCVSPVATCNGDKQTVTLTISTPPPFSPNITVFSNQFSGGDVNKAISVPGIGNGGATYVGKITAVGAFNGTSQVVTVSPNTGTQVTSQSVSVTYGSDDAPALKSFNVWAQANQGSNQVVLTIPNGSNCWIGTNQTISGMTVTNAFFAGIKNVIIEGTGATLDSVNGASLWHGAQGQVEIGLTNVAGKSARLKTVSANSSVVELTAASYSAGYISRFTIGAPVMVSGMDIQTGYGQNYGVPSNHQFFDRRIITAICNNTGPCTGTATITLDRPLTYTYLDTWPMYYDGSSGGLDQGGPATIYALNPFWDASIEYRGLTFNDTVQSNSQVRNLTYRNVTWNSCCGTTPSQVDTFTIRTAVLNINPSPGWEVDKLVGTVDIDGLTTVPRIDFQSSSVENLIMKNSTIGSMFGTPKNSQISDTSFAVFRPGAWTNGASTGAMTCLRCTVSDFRFDGGVDQGNTPSVFSMSSGVITVSNANNSGGNGPPHRLFVPGGNVYLKTTGYTTVGLLQTLAQTQDATNVYTATSEAGGFPGIAGYSPGFRVHPAPQYTCTTPDPASDSKFIATCTDAGASPLVPLGTYSSRSYTPASNNLSDQLWTNGKLVSLTVDVTVAGVGTGSLTVNPTGQFHNFTMNQATWTQFDWFPTINLKQAGKRVITPGGVTCDTGGGPIAGGCSGDTINSTNGFPPNAVWIQRDIQPFFTGSSYPTGWTAPQYTITIQTDQGVVP